MSFVIQPYKPKYQLEVIGLIEEIQEREYGLRIEEAQREELHLIPKVFQQEKGNYWVALFNEKVIGTIAVLDIGHNAFELRDVFLGREYRGSEKGYSKNLLDVVLEWSRAQDVQTIFLGTTLFFKRAHRFYEKNGFLEIPREEMPPYCKPMDCDEKFYCYTL